MSEKADWTRVWTDILATLYESIPYESLAGNFCSIKPMPEGDPPGVQLEMEMPGVSKENLSITVQNRRLSISGKKAGQDTVSYQHSFCVPKSLNHEKIEAKLSLGVLTIFIPKAPEAPIINIEIQAD